MAPAIFIITLAGLSLLALGLRGRLIQTRATCARCRYDLSGLAAAAETCPECGTSLARTKAVRTARRLRSPWVIAFGAFVLSLGLGGAGVMVWARATNFDWLSLAPTWYLLDQLDPWDDDEVVPIVNEIHHRIQMGRLSPAHVDQYVDRVLSADPPFEPRAPHAWLVTIAWLAAPSPFVNSSVQTRTVDWLLDRHADRTKPWDGYYFGTALESAALGSERSVLERYVAGIMDPLVWVDQDEVHSGENVSLHVRYQWRALRLFSALGFHMTAEAVGHAFVAQWTEPFLSGVVVAEPLMSVLVHGPPGEHRIPIRIRLIVSGVDPPIMHEFDREVTIRVLDDSLSEEQATRPAHEETRR